MDFWIHPDNLTRIFWLGGLWCLLSVTWASASVWIASDSESIFGKSSWPLASVCFGAIFFLITVMWGLSTTPIFAVGFIAALFFYTFSRDKKAPTQERILCIAFLKGFDQACWKSRDWRRWFSPWQINETTFFKQTRQSCGPPQKRWLTNWGARKGNGSGCIESSPCCTGLVWKGN